MASKKNSSSITLSFPNPFEAFFETIEAIRENAVNLSDEIFTSTRQQRMGVNKIFSSANFSKLPKFDKRKLLQIVVPVLVVLILGFGIVSIFKKSSNAQVAGVSTVSSTEVKTFPIDRSFDFPLTNDSGKSIGKFKYNIKSAELRHQIVIKGQSASAISGRVFLVINIEITNALSQGLQINTRDYLRISVNGNDQELFAPDIHNDPVEAQAISTTNTRVGLAINETDRDIKLQVGEINGKKTIIPLEFK